MADETIVVRIVTDQKEAVEALKKYRAEIDAAKEQIKKFASESGASYKDAAEQAKKSYEAQVRAQVKPDAMTGKPTKEALNAAKEEARSYASVVTEALKEINAEEKKVVASIKEEPEAREAALKAYKAQQALTATKARTSAKEERIDTALYQSKANDKALVSEAKAQSQAQIEAARAVAEEEKKSQEIIRAELKTTTQERIDAAKIAIEEAKAQATAEVERAKVMAANSDVVKAAADADKAQAAARKATSQAVMEEAKANNAAAMEEAKVRQAVAAADKAAADATIRAAETANAAQMAQAKADQMTGVAAQQAANAKIQESKAIEEEAKAAKAGEIAQEKLNQEINKTATSAAKAAEAEKKAASATTDVSSQNGKFAGTLGKLNGVLRLVFGTALGITALQALSKFRNYLKEAIDTAEQFTKVQFGLALALREIQRRGGEVDFGKVNAEIEALYQHFGIFSKKEITQSFTDVALRLSRFGATAEQVGKIVDIALVLKMTDVENRFDSVDEAAKVLATYLGSGYGEGLERAGAIAGRSADQLIAFENGMKTLYGSNIDPMERAMLRINFLFKQFSGQMDDAGKYVETASGRIDKANSKIKDATLALGDAMLGVTVKATEAWADFVDKFVTDVAPSIEESIIQLITLMDTFSSKFKDFQDSLGIKSVEDQRVKEYQSLIDALNKGRSKSEEKYLKSITEFFDKLKQWQPEEYKKMQTMFPKEFEDYLKYTGQLDERIKDATDSSLTFSELWRKNYNELKAEFEGLGKSAEDMFSTPPTVEGPITGNADQQSAQKIKEIEDDITKEILKAEKDRLELERKFWDDMGQIGESQLPNLMDVWNQYFGSTSNLTVQGLEDQQAIWEQQYGKFGSILNDALNKAMDIWRDYYDKLKDIAQKEMDDIADENREYEQRLEDNRRDMQQKLEDAARKYREAELKAERDYQEKLRRLREEYLFDLEDALRERDALQVIRLMRRYALDKAQLEREHDNEAQDRAEAYRQEIEDIRRQAARKEEELRIEHQRRLAEIALQAEREREQAEIDRQRAMDQLKEDIEKEKAEREQKYKDDQKALEDALTERIQTLLEKYQEENNLTEEQLTQISNKLQTWAKGIKNTHWDVANSIAAATQNIIANLQALSAMYQQTSNTINSNPINVSSLSQVQQANYSQPQTPYMPPGMHYANGGVGYATKPTWALYGEAGPEVATFTPVSKLNTNSHSPVGGSGNGIAGAAGGRIRLEVMLSPDLISRVVDDTLGQSAQIIESALAERGR